MKYFAFGSNMSTKRLRQRVPGAESLGTYSLQEHELRFHKVGNDGSGKCDAFFTGDRSETVMGVLYEIDESGKATLDRVEGLGYGYDEKEISVYDAQGNVERAVTYCATKFDESLLPYSWYKEHVLVGAVEANLSVEYIAQIKAIDAKTDPDRERSAEQRAIHT